MDGPTHLERIGPKGWLRYVFPFQLDDNYDIDHVSRIFRAGFDAAKQRLPAMGSEAVPAPETKRAYLPPPSLRACPFHCGDFGAQCCLVVFKIFG